MPFPTSSRPATFAPASQSSARFAGLSPTEASILRRIRRNDQGSGCQLTHAELGQAAPARPLSARQTRRTVAALLARGYLVDLGRAPGRHSPRILAVLPRRDVPAASSQRHAH